MNQFKVIFGRRDHGRNSDVMWKQPKGRGSVSEQVRWSRDPDLGESTEGASVAFTSILRNGRSMQHVKILLPDFIESQEPLLNA